jgi:hypothetical protein
MIPGSTTNVVLAGDEDSPSPGSCADAEPPTRIEAANDATRTS